MSAWEEWDLQATWSTRLLRKCRSRSRAMGNPKLAPQPRAKIPEATRVVQNTGGLIFDNSSPASTYRVETP